MHYSQLTPIKKAALKQLKKLRAFLKKTFRTKRSRRQAVYIISGIVIFILSLSLVGVSSQKHDLQTNLNERTQKLIELNDNLGKIRAQKVQTEQQVKERDKQLEDTKKQIDDLNKQLQAKTASKSLVARATGNLSPGTASAQTPSGAVAGCGDNEFAHFIYMHESGCNLNAVNALGCRGIGQACPGSKLPCGADYACQNTWFTDYANRAYGGWAGAYAFWVLHHWW